jgi:hypothetical protein
VEGATGGAVLAIVAIVAGGGDVAICAAVLFALGILLVTSKPGPKRG